MRWWKELFAAVALLSMHAAPLVAEVTARSAGSTLAAVEMECGDTFRFTLASGGVRELVLEDTSAQILLTNLREPRRGFGGGGTLYRFDCRVRIDGQPMSMVRYVPVQESFYEPYVINGMRIWFDGVKAIGSLFNETHGECLPRKAARFAVQDAALPICCEEELRPWYPNPYNRLDVHQAYNGDDVWMGPYQGADLHGGLDVNMPIGTPLWAPIGFDDQFYFNSLKQGANNNRWRGIRRWGNGQRWVLQAHHMTRLLVEEHEPLARGQHYAEAAGTLTGSHAHSHFVFKVGEEGEEILLDPWIVFWQIFENNKRRAAEIRAVIAPLEPATTGQLITFSSAGSQPGTEGNNLSFAWDFGDGGCSDEEHPNHTYARPGVYPITCAIDDGAERASTTQHITVSGPPTAAPALSLSAPEEIEFALRPPSAMEVYGSRVRYAPHTLRFLARPGSSPHPAAKRVVATNTGGGILGKLQSQIHYREGSGWLKVEHAGEDNAQEILVRVDASGLKAKHGVYRAAVRVTAPDCLNAPQVFFVELTTPPDAPPTEATVDELDDACWASPWFWVAPRFHGPWPRGHRGTYLIAAGPPDESGLVRYRPDLAAGRYEVAFAEETPFRPTEQTSPELRFAVRVRHRHATDVVWVEPLRSRSIGSFEFDEGNDGYVQIESDGAVGLIVADAVQFRPTVRRADR